VCNARALNFLSSLVREEPLKHEREAIESSDELVGRMRFLGFSDKVLASGGMRGARFSRNIYVSLNVTSLEAWRT
jgi:hypothetical protein